MAHEITEDMIGELISKYLTFSRAKNAADLAELFDESAIITFGDGKPWKGRSGIRAGFTLAFARERPELKTEIRSISVADDGQSAVVTELFTERYQERTNTGIATMHIRLADGELLIESEMVIITVSAATI